jgi:hypothetical protein
MLSLDGNCKPNASCVNSITGTLSEFSFRLCSCSSSSRRASKQWPGRFVRYIPATIRRRFRWRRFFQRGFPPNASVCGTAATGTLGELRQANMCSSAQHIDITMVYSNSICFKKAYLRTKGEYHEMMNFMTITQLVLSSCEVRFPAASFTPVIWYQPSN